MRITYSCDESRFPQSTLLVETQLDILRFCYEREGPVKFLAIEQCQKTAHTMFGADRIRNSLETLVCAGAMEPNLMNAVTACLFNCKRLQELRLEIDGGGDRMSTVLWLEFTAAIQRCTSLQRIKIHTYGRPSRRVQRSLLAPVRASTTLERLDIYRFHPSAEAIRCISSLWQNSPAFRSLDVTFCGGPVDAALELVRRLPTASHLKFLRANCSAFEADDRRRFQRAVCDALMDDDERLGNSSLTEVGVFPFSPTDEHPGVIGFYTALNKARFRGHRWKDMTMESWFDILVDLPTRYDGWHSPRLELSLVYFFLRYDPIWFGALS